MLALTLKVGERIRIKHDGHEGWLTLRRIDNVRSRVCLEFPIDFEIDREQIAARKDAGDAGDI